MNPPGTLAEIVRYWFDKAEESLLSAQDELRVGRLSFAVNRIYYACFYAVSGALMAENLRFKKHSGVRASFHQNLVKTGKIGQDLGKFYDELFEARQRGDYFEMVFFEPVQVQDWLAQAKQFVLEVGSLVNR
jgi:uncharacterized protein (UPF0332 family)